MASSSSSAPDVAPRVEELVQRCLSAGSEGRMGCRKAVPSSARGRGAHLTPISDET